MVETISRFDDVVRVGEAIANLRTYPRRLQDTPEGRQLLEMSPDEQRQFVLEAIGFLPPEEWTFGCAYGGITDAIVALLRRPLPFTHDDLVLLLEWTAHNSRYIYAGTSMINAITRFLSDHSLTPVLRVKIEQLIKTIHSGYNDASIRGGIPKLEALLDETANTMPLEVGDVWADAAIEDLRALDPALEAQWHKLLQACASASGAAPSKKWLAQTRPPLDAIAFPEFKAAVLRWLPLVDKPRTEHIPDDHPWHRTDPLLLRERNVDVLKGIVWLCAQRDDRDLARALAVLAVSAYRKIPGFGSRAPRLGNACVWALGAMPGQDGLVQLPILKTRVRFGTAQRMIEKAMAAGAQRAGLDTSEIEELLVPHHDLDDVGVRQGQFHTFTAELTIAGTTGVGIQWRRADGKRLASTPREVKEHHAEELAEWTRAVQDIKKMLLAQRDRIEALYLQPKTWSVPTWRERYLDHPLVGTLARRLIWRFRQGEWTASGIWHDGRIVDHEGLPLPPLSGATTVELWHPLHESTATVQKWRAWLVAHEVQQPFKQAHREVYVVTDAERSTRVYSNRFAAHILRQHQFNALAATRGWKNKLRLMVDDEYGPAERRLTAWNLRAEYWVEGAGGDYGTDTNETGTYRYLTTDQVRFYPIDAPQHSAHASGGGYHLYLRNGAAAVDPVQQEDVPALVFSEIMRDVDLFVGVASVGNDPSWADGGTERPYQQYWVSYAFGELAETAKMRREILTGLIPRLKIADRCHMTERYLVVRGDLRTYKIHLGSGNILMEPNDRYLCIVPQRGTAQAGSDKLFLPFEGDTVLAIILSKAVLLANDAAIKDRTILSQIR